MSYFAESASLTAFMLQDMRSPRFAYKMEESQPDVVEVLTKHAFPLSHSLVSLILLSCIYCF